MPKLNFLNQKTKEALAKLMLATDFDQKRITAFDDSVEGKQYCILLGDKSNPEDTRLDVWAELPIQWLEDATEDQMKDVGVWKDFSPENEDLITDWFQCNLQKWDVEVIKDAVFQKFLTEVYKEMEVLN